MKTIFFLSFQLFISATAITQWVYEATLPNAGTHVPSIWQVRVIDSSVSWAFGNINVNQNEYYPYFARRSREGWQYINTALDSFVNGYCFTATDSLNVWLGTFHPEEIYYSSNGGLNWSLQFHEDTGHVVGLEFCKQSPQIGYASATMAFNGFWNGARILKTTNRGLNWIVWDFEFYAYHAIENSICVVDSNYVWIGVSSVSNSAGKIISTTNGGISWNVTDVNAGQVCPATIQFSSDKQTGLFVGETPPTSWFYRTTNAGLNWNIVYTTTYYYSETMRWIPGTSNVYGNSEFVIVRSTDNGLTWHNMSGAPNTALRSIDAVRINENTVYGLAVTYFKEVYKLIDTARIIGIKNPIIEIPKEFNLYQNYPNPFNPVTKIKYSIQKDAGTTLKIYNSLGQLMTTLVNSYLKAGEYEVNFNGENYPSGLYFYVLESGDYVSTKKMVLIK